MGHPRFSSAKLIDLFGLGRAESNFFKMDMKEVLASYLRACSLLSLQDSAEGSVGVDSFAPKLDLMAGDALLVESGQCTMEGGTSSGQGPIAASCPFPLGASEGEVPTLPEYGWRTRSRYYNLLQCGLP